MTVVSLKQFVEAGVHFGHQTRRWHPKMRNYIYGAKQGIHIIDLRKTLYHLKSAYEFVRDETAEGRTLMFVGTKPQIQDIIAQEASRCGSFYINERWLGGLLTNFNTIRQSVERLKLYEEMAGPDGRYEGFLKKEALQIDRKRQKLERSLCGVKNMKSLPSIIFIVDCQKEHIAVEEARKLRIPIVAVVDTNCDPSGIDRAIPGNDDSPRAVKLFASVMATAVLEGQRIRAQRTGDDIPVEGMISLSETGDKTPKTEEDSTPVSSEVSESSNTQEESKDETSADNIREEASATSEDGASDKSPAPSTPQE